MEVSECCIMAKLHPSEYLQYLGWPMHLPSHHFMHAHWGIPCEDTLFQPQQICPTKTVPSSDGDIIHVDSMVDFGWGSEPKDI